MLRRDFLLQSAATAGLILAGPLLTPSAAAGDSLSALASALRGRTRPDLGLARSLEQVTTQLSAMFGTTPAIGLEPLVRGHLATLTDLLRDSGATADVRGVLASSAAETLVLAGWLSQDGGDDMAADAAYRLALEAAEACDDKPIAAYAIASASTLGHWRSSPAESIDLLTSGTVRGFTANDATPTTKAWIGSLLAEAHTRGGDEVAAMTALDVAVKALDKADDGPRPRAQFFDRARLIGERGVIAQRLAMADARTYLQQALAGLEGHSKTRSRYLTAQARALTNEGDLDEAVNVAVLSLHLASSSGSQVGVDDIRRFRSELPDSTLTTALDQALAAA